MNIVIDPEFKAFIHSLKTEEYAQLEQNIKDEGCRDPLVLWGNVLVDGHNRYEICTRHGIAFNTVSKEFKDRDAVMDWMDANQLGRRNLTPDQFTYHLGRLYNRQKKALGGQIPNSRVDQIEPPISTAEKLAKEHAVSAATVKRAGQIASAVERAAPEIQQAMKAGLMPVTQAAKIADASPEFQRAVAKKVTEENTKPNEAIRLVKAETIEAREIETPSGKFRVIYADPPWSYGNTMPDDFKEQRDHYPVMSMDDLCAMPVKDMAADDAVLFLWVTSPILEESFALVKAWGFKYKASFVWDKVGHVMGHYNSVRHEFLLVCVRGSCQPDVRKLFDSVVTEERTSHSKKPAQFYEMIETIYTQGRRIELFARNRRDGWEAYGYEPDKFAA